MNKDFSLNRIIVDVTLMVLLLGILVLPILSMGFLGFNNVQGNEDILPATTERNESESENLVNEVIDERVSETTEATSSQR